MHSSANTARFAIIALLGLLTGAMGTATVTAGTDFTSRDGSPVQHAMLTRGGAGLDGMAFVRPVLKGVDDDETPSPAGLNGLRQLNNRKHHVESDLDLVDGSAGSSQLNSNRRF